MDEIKKRKERTETSCRNVKSKDGTFSPHIGVSTATRLIKYCELLKINKTKFVEECINTRLDVLEDEYYFSLSKEQLIELIKKK